MTARVPTMNSLKLLDLLRRVERFQFQTFIDGADAGHGTGRVQSEVPRGDTVVMRESGRWRPNGMAELAFTNAYRWTAIDPQTLSLEHLRRGTDQPVLLGSLTKASEDRWSTVDPYRCLDDFYRATLQRHAGGVRLEWTVTGPKKDHRIEVSFQFPEDADSEWLLDR